MFAKLQHPASLLLIGCPLIWAGQPNLHVASPQLRQPIPQQELNAQGQGTAVIFIGGFGDEISGIIPHMRRYLPPLSKRECRAYYHWHAGCPQSVNDGATTLARHIENYRRYNPAADVVIIGHSMGASMALRTAHLLRREDGRLFLITLDPADRSYTPQRPPAVIWWGNAYVVNSQSNHDYIAQLGGRWNKCRGADNNICFDGRDADEAGLLYIHDNAFSLMMSRGRGRHPSLNDLLKQQLRKEGQDSPEDAKSTPKLPPTPINTR